MAVSIIAVIIITLVVCGIGGGIGYLIWLITRPPKITWKASCYQLGEGVKPLARDEKGNIISELKLNDLRPYRKDILERVVKDYGVVVYRLQKENITTTPVTADCVEYWGEKDKHVAVLIVGENASVLKKGYDKKTGNVIFRPMRQDRINIITNNMIFKKERLTKEKDILTAITPWVVTGIAIIGLVLICYILGKAFLEITTQVTEAQKYQADRGVEASKVYENVFISMGIVKQGVNVSASQTVAVPPPLR